MIASVPDYLKARAQKQADVCLDEARAALAKIVPVVERALQDHQKTISRELAPRVRAALLDGYDRANAECGDGCVKRSKVRVSSWIDRSCPVSRSADWCATGHHA